MHEKQPVDHSEDGAGGRTSSESGARNSEIAQQARTGAEFFYKISDIPPVHRISSEHKILFSTISEAEDRSGFPVDDDDSRLATFTALGLEYQGKRYPYNDGYRQLIHRAVLLDHLSDTRDYDDFSERLRKQYDWEEGVSEFLSKELRTEAEQAYLDRCREMRQSYDNLRRSEPVYKTSLKAWLPAEFIPERDALRAERDEKIKQIKDLSHFSAKDKLAKEYQANLSRSKEIAEAEFRRTGDNKKHKDAIDNAQRTYEYNASRLKKLGDPEIREVLSKEYRNSYIKQESLLREKHWDAFEREEKKWEAYKKKYRQDFKQHVLSNNILTEAEFDETNNYIELRDKLISELVDLHPRMYRTGIDGFAHNFENSIGLVAVRHIMEDKNSPYYSKNGIADAIKGRLTSFYALQHKAGISNDLPEIEKGKVAKQIREKCPDEKREEAFEKLRELEKLATDYYYRLKPVYLNAEKLFGSPHYKEIEVARHELEKITHGRDQFINEYVDDQVKARITRLKNDIGKIALGGRDGEIREVGVFPTGLLVVSSAGPLIPSISPMSDEMLKIINDYGLGQPWRQFWVKHQTDCNKVARRALVEDSTKKAEMADDWYDEHIRILLKKNQLSLPSALDIETGRVRDALQSSDLETLQNLPSEIFGFIGGIGVKDTGEETTLRSARLEAMRFFNGYDEKSLSLCNDGQTLQIRTVEKLFSGTEDEKFPRALSRVLVEIGASSYLNLKPLKRAEFSKMIGTRANISDVKFRQLYGRRPMNANDKRGVLERTIFVKCFLDYIDGKAGAEVTKFFNEIKKKPLIKSHEEA